jgi:predicted 2-oxoglutarate/Fe(II)-dependent dioxygenase YbiX
MCNQLNRFEVEKYLHLKNFLDVKNCNELTAELKRLVEQKVTQKDEQCQSSEAIYGAAMFEKFLLELLPYFEKLSGKRLYPTYSYARLYKNGEKLKIHTDREACEISATLTVGFDGEPWSIYMGDKNKENASKIDMDVGDAVLYRGMEKHHWRKKFKGNWQAQIFLHYVDADGPYKEWKFDKRSDLGLHVKVEPDEIREWVYTDILSPEMCDGIVESYTSSHFAQHPPEIGRGVIDRSIRNVERVMLPIYKDIGGLLVAAGLSANNQAWKFDITHSNQCEFLIYPTNGKYKSHVDTLLAHSNECRKLTVLAFLNDDFKGGRFYLQNGHEKFYPPQSKGTVIVFPSFIMHGVEDVEEGTRYSAVCWMVGKFFR